MFLIRPSHCLHVVTMSPSAHPNRPTQVPSDWGGKRSQREGRLWKFAEFSKSYGHDPSTERAYLLYDYLVQLLDSSCSAYG